MHNFKHTESSLSNLFKIGCDFGKELLLLINLVSFVPRLLRAYRVTTEGLGQKANVDLDGEVSFDFPPRTIGNEAEMWCEIGYVSQLSDIKILFLTVLA